MGGGVAGGREGQGRGEAPPPPPSGRHFVSVGSLRGLRFLLPLPAPGARHERAAHSASAGRRRRRRQGCAQEQLRNEPSAPRAHSPAGRLGLGLIAPAAGPGRAGAGAAAVHGGAAGSVAPPLRCSAKSFLLATEKKKKKLPQLLSMPSAAARPGKATIPRSGFLGRPRERGGAAGGAGRTRVALGFSGTRRAGGRRESRQEGEEHGR